jgi:pimeloyl-ACP methyl ester carboxylesterase
MKRWVRYGIRVLLGLVVVSVVGALYQFIGNAIDQRRYPPPGKLIDVGGHQLHLYCTGAGSPTVVLDAMGNGWSLYWSTVQPEIAKFTRVCSYDRAGYGWSDPGPTPRTAQQVAIELHTLLANAQVPGPYVLVGHSFSGFTVRLFRNQDPREVVGMVLVEAGHEDVWQDPESRKSHDALRRVLPALRVGAALGTMRLLATLDKTPLLPGKQLQEVPPEVRPLLRAGLARTSYVTTIAQEDAALPETHEEVRAAGTLGDLPLVVLTATGLTWTSNLPAGVDKAQIQKVWLELQQKLTTLSTHSSQLFADKSSHYMQFDQPEVIVDGVRRMVEETRQKPK